MCSGVSTKTTKVLVVGKDAAEQSPHAVITIRGEVLEVVSQFKYLGSQHAIRGECASWVLELRNILQQFPPNEDDPMLDTEIAHKVADASSAFARLHQAKVWSKKALYLSTKLQFLQTIVMTVLLYGGETWSLLDKHLNQLSVFTCVV